MDSQSTQQTQPPKSPKPPARDFIRRRLSDSLNKRRAEKPQDLKSPPPPTSPQAVFSKDNSVAAAKTPTRQPEASTLAARRLPPSTPTRQSTPQPQNLKPRRPKAQRETMTPKQGRTPSPSPGRTEPVSQPAIQWSTPVGPSARLPGGMGSLRGRKDERTLEERLYALKTEDEISDEDAWEDMDDGEGSAEEEHLEKRKRTD